MRRNTVITMLTVAALGWTAQAQQEHPDLLGGPDQDFTKSADENFRGARRGGAQRMTAEEAVQVWTAQATGVATRLELSQEQTAQLAQAYVAHRESIHEATQAMRGEGQGNRVGQKRGDRGNRGARGEQAQGENRGRGQRRARPEMSDELRAALDAEKAIFESAVGEFLNAEQAELVVATFGRPHRGWDHMVRTIVGFELDASSQAAALGAIESYMNKMADVRGMRGGGDREIMRGAMMEAREALRTELEGVLSDDELEKFASSVDPRGRPGARGQRGDREGRGLGQLDVNGDGVLQKEELPERMQERFADLDANGDGELDASEMAAMRRGRGGPGRDGTRRGGGQGRGATE